jgi:hypothetical protein
MPLDDNFFWGDYCKDIVWTATVATPTSAHTEIM